MSDSTLPRITLSGIALPRIARGTSAFWKANIALFLGAMSVFALLYSVQPLLPLFSQEFGLSAGASSLSLSVTTAAGSKKSR